MAIWVATGLRCHIKNASNSLQENFLAEKKTVSELSTEDIDYVVEAIGEAPSRACSL